MNRSAESVESVTFTNDESVVVPMSQQDIKTTFMPATYTIGKNVLVVAVELLNGTPTREDLRDLNFNLDTIEPIETCEMATFLTNHNIVPPPAKGKEPDRSPDEANQVVEKDREYYFTMVGFECEDVEFLVPQWRLRSILRTSELTDRDAYAICKVHASPSDFRNLMEVVYPFDPMQSDQLSLPYQSWVSILKLASRPEWFMVDYRKQALAKLEGGSYTIPPEDKVVLGRLCGLPKWCREGYDSFARGEPDLRSEHKETIGIVTMLRITRARDAAYQDDVAMYHQQYPGPSSFINAIPSILVGDNPPESRGGADLIAEFCAARESRQLGWLQACYERLIDREACITLEEISCLGLDTTAELWKARHQLFRQYRRAVRSNVDPNFAPHVEIELRDQLEKARMLMNSFKRAEVMVRARKSKKPVVKLPAGKSSGVGIGS